MGALIIRHQVKNKTKWSMRERKEETQVSVTEGRAQDNNGEGQQLEGAPAP